MNYLKIIIFDNTIYYFSLKEFLNDKFNIDLSKNMSTNDLNKEMGGDFKKIYLGLIRKYFPNFKERDLSYYPAYQKSSKEYDNIHELIENNYKIFSLLNSKINDDDFYLKKVIKFLIL